MSACGQICDIGGVTDGRKENDRKILDEGQGSCRKKRRNDRKSGSEEHREEECAGGKEDGEKGGEAGSEKKQLPRNRPPKKSVKKAEPAAKAEVKPEAKAEVKPEAKTAIKQEPAAEAKKTAKQDKLAQYEKFSMDSCIAMMQAMGVTYTYDDYARELMHESDLAVIVAKINEDFRLNGDSFDYDEDGYDSDLTEVTVRKVADTMDFKASDFPKMADAATAALCLCPQR